MAAAVSLPNRAPPRKPSPRQLQYAESDLSWYHEQRHADLGVRGTPYEPVTATSDPDQTGAKIVKLGDARHALAVRRLYAVEPRLFALSAFEREHIAALYCSPPVRGVERHGELTDAVGVAGAGVPLAAHQFFLVPDTNVRAVGLALRLLPLGRSLLHEFRPRTTGLPRWVHEVRDAAFEMRRALLTAYATVRPWDDGPAAVENSKKRREPLVAARGSSARDHARLCRYCGAVGGEACWFGCPSAR